VEYGRESAGERAPYYLDFTSSQVSCTDVLVDQAGEGSLTVGLIMVARESINSDWIWRFMGLKALRF